MSPEEAKQLWFWVGDGLRHPNILSGLLSTLVNDYPAILKGAKVLSKDDLDKLSGAAKQEAADLFSQDHDFTVLVGLLFQPNIFFSTNQQGDQVFFVLNKDGEELGEKPDEKTTLLQTTIQKIMNL